MTIQKVIALCVAATLYGCGGDDGISQEYDPQYAVSPAHAITQADIDNWNAAASATEADPVFNTSPAATISVTDLSNWNTAASAAETDPLFTASIASAISLLDVSAWNAAANATEGDPVFVASTAASINQADIDNWNAAATATEADPVFSASTASAITQTDVNKWNSAASGLGALTTNTVPVWNGSALADSSIKESGGKIGIAADVSSTAKVTVPTARFGSFTTSDTVKNCATPGFSWTHTPPSAGACNTYCVDQGFAAGSVSASGTRMAAGATCDYISNFETCAVSSMPNSNCNSRATSFNCTCQKLTTELTSDVRVTNGDMQLDGYLRLGQTTGAPPAADCDAASEYGRMLTDPASGYLWICSSSGWNAK